MCPADAIKLVLADDAEMAARVAAEGLRGAAARTGRQAPRLLQEPVSVDKAFIARHGRLCGDTDECAEGARATVTADGVVVGEAFTNNYGDFVVDRLEPGEREYELVLEAAGYLPVRRTVRLEASVNLGVLLLAGA